MPYVNYEVEDRIAYITLARPEKRNALNYDVVMELKKAFTKAESDITAKVVVLRAEGVSFCAGADLDYLESLQKNSYEDNLSDSMHLMQLFKMVYTFKKVVIAQVNGSAVAGGCGLVTVCDFAFTIPEAKFGYSEVRIGFVPAIVSIFLKRKIAEAKARELLIGGELISAEKAHSYGIVNEIFAADQLASKVKEFCQNLIKNNSSDSMSMAKQVVWKVQSMSLDEALKYAADMNARARANADCKKGISAFLNKENLEW